MNIYIRVVGGEITYVEKENKKPSEWLEVQPSGNVHYESAHPATVDNPNTPEDVTANAVNTTIIVSNTPGAALPNTGGSGTVLYTISGSIMTLLAGWFLLMKRCKVSD